MSNFMPRNRELFSITKQTDPVCEAGLNVIVTGGENGGVESTMPVISILLSRGIGVRALFADAGLSAFVARGDLHGLQAQPLDAAAGTIQEPDALVFSPSVDGSLEEDLNAMFDVPQVVIEDYYESARIAIELAIKAGIKLPTICVIDEQAKKMIGQRFSGISVPIEVTGPSAFSKLAGEDITPRGQKIKSELDIPDKKLIVVQLPYLKHVNLAGEISDACMDMREDVIFAVRRHPRDDADYSQIFEGMRHIDTSMYDTESLSTAADIVIAQRSTCSLLAAIRQQPNISLNRFIEPGFTLPLVDAGASLKAIPTELPQIIDELLEGKSERYKTLRVNMEPYRVDGKEASRIADVVCRAMVSRSYAESAL